MDHRNVRCKMITLEETVETEAGKDLYYRDSMEHLCNFLVALKLSKMKALFKRNKKSEKKCKNRAK